MGGGIAALIASIVGTLVSGGVGIANGVSANRNALLQRQQVNQSNNLANSLTAIQNQEQGGLTDEAKDAYLGKFSTNGVPVIARCGTKRKFKNGGTQFFDRNELNTMIGRNRF